jgi:hypothetical protein
MIGNVPMIELLMSKGAKHDGLLSMWQQFMVTRKQWLVYWIMGLISMQLTKKAILL